MPRWFIILAGLAAIGLVAAQSGDLVLVTTLFSFGLMIPVWFVAVNLWWVMILLAPPVWCARRGRLPTGIAISATLVFVVYAALFHEIAQQRQALMQEPFAAQPGGALKLGPPRSIEILLVENQTSQEDCDGLCQSLLTGPDIQWVRVSHATNSYAQAHSMIFYRGKAARCTALRRAFDVTAPCLMARLDEVAQTDLRLEITQSGDFVGPMSPERGLVYATGIEKLVLTDLRTAGAAPLDVQIRQGWSEAIIGPLSPTMTALGSGRKGEGPVFLRRRDEAGSFDPRAALAFAGVTLGPDHAAFGAPLPPSAPATSPRGSTHQKEVPAVRLVEGIAPDAPPPVPQSETVVVGRIVNGQYEVETLFVQIIQSPDDAASQAVRNLAYRMYDAPVGAYDGYGDLFQKALQARPMDALLVPLTGRFAFDPAPVLRARWTAGADPAADELTLKAVCAADARWSVPLVVFVQEAAASRMPKPGDTVFDSGTLNQAAKLFLHLGRPDLSTAMWDQVDWNLVARMSSQDGSPQNPMLLRILLPNLTNGATHC